jgi:hypothetical protein
LLGAKQFLARVVFFDSHSLAAHGKNAQGKNRMTRVKMDSPSFHGLRVALQDADARIGIEDDIPSSVPFVMGIKPPSKESVSLPNGHAWLVGTELPGRP